MYKAEKLYSKRGLIMDDMIITFANTSEKPKETIYFNDGRMQRKNDTKIYSIIHTVFWIAIVIIVIGNIIFKDFLSIEESSGIAIGLFIIGIYLLKGGHVRRECPAQLIFYEDFLIFYTPRFHMQRGQERMELYKIYYKDVKMCKYRVNIKKMCIYGMLDLEYYNYDKSGNLNKKKPFKNHCDSMIKFYTVFDNEHDFVQIIERNTSLKVQFENS